MKYVYSAYVAQREVSHSYDKGVPKNITYRTQLPTQVPTRTRITQIGFGLAQEWSLIFANQVVNKSEDMLQDLAEIFKED